MSALTLTELSLRDRQRALHVLVEEKGTPGGEWSLLQLDLERDPVCRWYLLKSLGHSGLVIGIAKLLQIGSEPDVEVGVSSLHMIAAWSLGRIGNLATSQVLEQLEKATSENDLVFLVDSLGEIRDPKAIPALVKSMEVGAHRVRMWAALSLAKMGAEAARPMLQLLVKSGVATDRAMLIDAFSRIANAAPAEVASNFKSSLSQREAAFLAECISKRQNH